MVNWTALILSQHHRKLIWGHSLHSNSLILRTTHTTYKVRRTKTIVRKVVKHVYIYVLHSPQHVRASHLAGKISNNATPLSTPKRKGAIRVIRCYAVWEKNIFRRLRVPMPQIASENTILHVYTPTPIEKSCRNAIQVIDSRPLVALLAAAGNTNRGRELHELRPRVDNILKNLR